MPSQIDISNRALSICGTRSGMGGNWAGGIASMTENSPEAMACNLHFIPVLKALLRLAPWSFARTVIPGALVAAAPGTPENPSGVAPLPLVPTGTNPVQIVSWLYEYAWPNDCVRLRRVQMPLNIPGAAGTVPLWPGVNMSTPSIPGLDGRVNYQIGLDKDSKGNQIKVILTDVENALIVYTALVDNPNLWDDEFSEAYVFMLASHLVGALIGDKQMDQALYAKANQIVQSARAVDGNEQPISPSHTPDWIRVRSGPEFNDE